MPPPMATISAQRSRPSVTSSVGQLGAERHPAVERRHDRLDRLPLVEHRLGGVEHGLDVDRSAAVGGQGVGVEDEVAVLEAQQLEHDLGRAVGERRAAGLAGDDRPTVEPDAARPTATGQPKLPGLLGRGQQPQNVGKGKGFERALKSHDDLREGDGRVSIGRLGPKLEDFRAGRRELAPQTGCRARRGAFEPTRRCAQSPPPEGPQPAASRPPGPAIPVQSSKASAAWCTSIPSPFEGAQAPRLGRRQERGHGREVDEVGHQRAVGERGQRGGRRAASRSTSIPTDVAFTTRSAAARSRPRSVTGAAEPTAPASSAAVSGLVGRAVHDGDCRRRRPRPGPGPRPGPLPRRRARRIADRRIEAGVGPQRRHEAGAVGVVADEAIAVAGRRS